MWEWGEDRVPSRRIILGYWYNVTRHKNDPENVGRTTNTEWEMPVIVIGADTDLGHAIVPALRPASGEIRVFASSAEAVARYRPVIKAAVGDISDGTHVGGAAIGAFCAIVIAAAAYDDRERYFAETPQALFEQWASGLADAGISRVIVVGADPEVPEHRLDRIGAEYIRIQTEGRDLTSIADLVAAAEGASG